MTTLLKEDVVRMVKESKIYDWFWLRDNNIQEIDAVQNLLTLARADIVEANKALVAENERLKSYFSEERGKLLGTANTIDQLTDQLINQLTATRTALAAAEAREEKLKSVLQRIISYYDLSKTGSSLPSLTVQAKSEHENTMFGEARKILCKEVKYHLPDDVSECGISC